MVLDIWFFLQVLVFPGFIFILFLTLFCDWVERKIEARMQNRVGPAVAGPGGILQPLADFIKLLTKEDIVPLNAKQVLFKAAPILSFAILVFAVSFLPIDDSSAIPNAGFAGDLIFIMALVTLANFLLFLSGWASSNPYGSIGAARVLTQFLGYDIPLLLLALAPAYLAGTLSIAAIAASQVIPFIILAPWAFVLFIITLQAELEKDPFDIPHADSEVVGGLETEYCGGKLAFLHLSRDVQIVFGAALVVELFLGGPYGPVFFGVPQFWYTLWFVLKLLAVIIISEYLTTLFARLRIDQVVTANWRVILPLSVIAFALTVALGVWIYPMVNL
ncbi:MAG TPA: complex I subunit 1 family protein [Candidatus Sulfotelmatobacter sp.]|nr:complex I subunit 1 family protein [Candidatus Sulfotelmatobacter sp.]